MQSSRVSIYLAACLTILILPSGWHSANSETIDVVSRAYGSCCTFIANGAPIQPSNNRLDLSNNDTRSNARAIANIRHTIDAGNNANGGAKTSCSLLHAFGNNLFDGPRGALIQARNGNLYGTTYSGGANNNGTVFKVTPGGVESVLYSFGGIKGDGREPGASLLQAKDGNFYGTTLHGGEWGAGTVFKITPSGVETILLSFGSSLYYPPDGSDPSASLIQAKDGNFYGTTHGGGAYINGTVFQVTPAGVETVLHSFGGTIGDGYDPEGSLIQARDGNFYGTTTATAGSGHFGGTVFKVTPAGAETVLHAFGTTRGDGTRPRANLVEARDGNLYGTTLKGGANDEGTVFKIAPAGVETVLHSFGGTKGDGQEPAAGLILSRDGNFYGTTTAGGVAGRGIVFSITPAGVETVLHSFTGRDGYYPAASLIQAADGNLYGTTEVTIFGCTLR